MADIFIQELMDVINSRSSQLTMLASLAKRNDEFVFAATILNNEWQRGKRQFNVSF